MDQNVTCLIKPEGHAFAPCIWRQITESGLCVVAHKPVRLSEGVLRQIYCSTSGDMWSYLVGLFATQPSELGLVQGPNALERLTVLVGEHDDPSQCACGTLRQLFSWQVPVRVDGSVYYPNVIHIPRTKEEAARQLRFLAPLLF